MSEFKMNVRYFVKLYNPIAVANDAFYKNIVRNLADQHNYLN